MSCQERFGGMLGMLRLAGLIGLVCVGGAALAANDEKVVVIGFDGADARLVQGWMDEGQLPNLAALREEGTFAPLEPTNPPQTPVSWSSFATGLQPGRTEIFDFLKRDPDNYLPDFAMMSETRRTFLFGERNGLMIGLIVGGAVLLLLGLASLPFRMRWWLRLGVAALPAAAVGAALGMTVQDLLPQEVPAAVNNRQGQTMWQLAADDGHTVQVIRVPATFPAEPVSGGHMLSGLGVPDMRGRIGTPSFYTSDPDFDAGDNQFSVEILSLPARRGKIETRVVGPYNKPFYDYVVDRRAAAADPREHSEARKLARRELEDRGVERRLDLPLRLEVTDRSVSIDLAGRVQTIEVGQWSDWYELNFPVNGLVDRVSPLKGISRFKLLQLEPELQLYMSPIHFHPDCHPVAFSWPEDYSEEILDRFGLYKTMGWALDTWSLPQGIGDEELFLEDMEFTVAKYREIMRGLLAEDNDLYIQIFYFTDRIGHLLWRYMDEGHGLHVPELAERYQAEMLAAYKKMDEIVGEAREIAGEDVTFIVCSDHGFSSFRRGVNYNNWLVENGYMVLTGEAQEKATLEKLFDTRDLFPNVNWDKTKAYAMGLGSIYINLAGRERNGIVLPGPEYDAVRAEIKEGLEALVDPETGDKPITRVWTREEMYGQFDPDLIPDLRAGNNLNYRVSWQTSLGGFGQDVIEDNTKVWSGDHCSNDPSVVPGILFINRKINTETPRMLDLMPTVLEILGTELPADLDGRPLL